jgi:hypothetical protein
MALSLADELGSAFDNSIEIDGGSGPSLAEEFGFVSNDDDGHDELDPEFGKYAYSIPLLVLSLICRLRSSLDS